MISYITEENKRRKRKRIILTELYFESVLLGMAYLISQRAPRSSASFSDDEQKYTLRKYLLKACYDQLRLTKRNFHDLCTMLRCYIVNVGDMKGSFQDAMKSLEPLELPKVTPPLEILAALEKIPDLARLDMLRAYGKLILSERLFQALMELPMEFRKEWLLMLNEKNNV
uniref:Uncharacterized protein n=1 Tax=Triticum aestivum TaxID=4565 RepID=A0A3B6CGL1_WHEAT